jgi:hypothetical protein
MFRPSVKPGVEGVDQGVLNPATLNTRELTAGFESAGWHNLNNQSAEITVSGNKIRFIGIDDFHIGLGKLDTVQKRISSPSH